MRLICSKRRYSIRLHTLCQFDFDSNPVMPMILCGQDALIDKLVTISAKPLASRIVGRSHMNSLQLKDMKGYIEHHLRLAGLEKSIFAEEAILAIHQTSGGLLRRANIIARGAMMAAAYGEKSCRIRWNIFALQGQRLFRGI